MRPRDHRHPAAPVQSSAGRRHGRWKAFTAVACAAGLAVLAPLPADGQVEVTVSDRVTCPDCEIVLTRVATLGKLSDEVSFSQNSLFAVDPDRRHIYAALTYTPGTIALYDWSGNFVKTFGRPGAGPGEFGTSLLGVSLMVDAAGNVHVFERGRRTVVRPGLAELVRAQQVPVGFDFATVLSGGRTLLSAPVLSGMPGSELYVMLDSLGREIGRYGAVPPGGSPVGVAPRANGGFLGPHLRQYRIEQYRPDGTMERVIRRQASWFPPPGRDPPPLTTPTFGRVWEESADRLWTVVRVPDPNQSRVLSAPGEQALRVDRMDWNAVQDTRIEVIDPTTGQLLATRRFDHVLVLIGDGYIVHKVETPEGIVQAIVSRLSLSIKEE